MSMKQKVFEKHVAILVFPKNLFTSEKEPTKAL